MLTAAHLRAYTWRHMNEAETFVLADQTLNRVVAQIRDGQWSERPTSILSRQRDNPPSLRELVNHHAYDDSWVPDMLAGRTMEEAGKDRFQGDLLGEDPKAAFAAIVERACEAARALTDLDRTVHCSFGDYPARGYLWQINGFRGLRAYEIAKAIGIDPTLPDDLVRALWDELRPVAEEWRAIGVFAAAVPVPEDAPLQDRLLALTGRDPYA
jgi:uncharacterized protein (TIGR03086 family)